VCRSCDGGGGWSSPRGGPTNPLQLGQAPEGIPPPRTPHTTQKRTDNTRTKHENTTKTTHTAQRHTRDGGRAVCSVREHEWPAGCASCDGQSPRCVAGRRPCQLSRRYAQQSCAAAASGGDISGGICSGQVRGTARRGSTSSNADRGAATCSRRVSSSRRIRDDCLRCTGCCLFIGTFTRSREPDSAGCTGDGQQRQRQRDARHYLRADEPWRSTAPVDSDLVALAQRQQPQQYRIAGELRGSGWSRRPSSWLAQPVRHADERRAL